MTNTAAAAQTNDLRRKGRVSPARVEALRILDRFHRKRLPLGLILSEHRWGPLESRDRNLATELVYGTVRWEIQLDWLLSQFIHGRLKEYPLTVQNILRLGLYQLRFLQQIPDYAVVNESVQLARRSGRIRFARLVNAVLRNYLRRRDAIAWPQKEDGLRKYLSVTQAFPVWMVDLLLEQYGPEVTENLLQRLNQRPGFSLRVNLRQTSREEEIGQLRARGISAEPSPLLPEFIRLRGAAGPVRDLPGFAAGHFFVQDESAGLVSHVAERRNQILDVCSAPGGKLTHLRERLGEDVLLIGADLHKPRLQMVAENFARLRLRPPQLILADGRNLPFPKVEQIFLDVPCSGLGVIRKSPDIKLRRTPEEVAGLVRLQRDLLEEAAKLSPPGGVIIYSTCTINREENEGVLNAFLADHPEFKPVPIRGWEDIREPGKEWLFILPTGENVDGAFVAKLRKGSV